MKNKQWTIWDILRHKLLHWAYDALILMHDWLINYACERDLWLLRPLDDQN